MRRPRTAYLNAGLAVLLLAAGTGAYLSIGDPPQARTAATRQATVTRGTLSASITGTGNAASASSVGVNFAGSGGVLTQVYVQPGQKVTGGQPLARVDATAAQQSLQTARAQLTSAQAQYNQTAQGATALQQQKDQLAVQSAQLSLNAARNTLANAKSQLALDTTQQNQLVAAAKANLAAGTGTQAQVTQAEQNRASVLAKDQQAITQAQQQVATAANQLAQQKLAATADVTPTPAALAQAAAQLNSAKVAVAQAQKVVDQTLLAAPQAGTVVSVSGKVGQTVSGGGSASSSSSGTGSSGTGSSGTGSSGTGSSGTGSSGSGSSGTSSSSTSGFIVLADLSTLTVTANVAEADAASVKVGQPATVTFQATNTTAQGEVTQVSLQSTTSSNVIEYPVTVTLQNVPAAVRLGATASVSITTGSVQDALIVPSSAVTTLGQNHTVIVLRDKVETVLPVEVGLVGDRGTQIVSGVAEGDTLVLPTSTTSSGTSNGFPRVGGIGGIGGGRG